MGIPIFPTCSNSSKSKQESALSSIMEKPPTGWYAIFLRRPLLHFYTISLIMTFFPLKNYDIDVPLFLPIYAESRLSDLRAIAADQLNVSISLIVTFLRKNLKSFCFEIQGSARH